MRKEAAGKRLTATGDNSKATNELAALKLNVNNFTVALIENK